MSWDSNDEKFEVDSELLIKEKKTKRRFLADKLYQDTILMEMVIEDEKKPAEYIGNIQNTLGINGNSKEFTVDVSVDDLEEGLKLEKVAYKYTGEEIAAMAQHEQIVTLKFAEAS